MQKYIAKIAVQFFTFLEDGKYLVLIYISTFNCEVGFSDSLSLAIFAYCLTSCLCFLIKSHANIKNTVKAGSGGLHL